MRISERKYYKNKVITFSSTKAPFGGLSNMAPGYSVRVNDVIIPTVEALYQACRFPLFPEIQQEIIEQHSPMTAKMISRKYLRYTRQDWEIVKYKIMYWCLEIKLSQNYDKFSSLLLETGDNQIVEYSNKNKDWAAMPVGDNYLVGKNALGRLLMQLRSEYVIEKVSLDCVPPLNIIAFYLYGTQIATTCSPAEELKQGYLFDLELC